MEQFVYLPCYIGNNGGAINRFIPYVHQGYEIWGQSGL